MAKKKQLAKLTKDVTKIKNRTLSNHTKTNSFYLHKCVDNIIFVETALLFLWKKASTFQKVTTLFTKGFLSAQLVNHRLSTILYLFRLQSHMEGLEKKLIYWCHMYMRRTSQPDFLVTKNNAIRNCYDITLFRTGNGRFHTHLSIGDVTRDDSQRLIFCAQHHITVLRHYVEWLQHCSNIATLCCAQHLRCKSSRVTSPLGAARCKNVLFR